MTNKYHSSKERNLARTMRKKGASLKDMAVAIGASKSTVRLWTKDVVLSPEAKKRLYTSQMLKMTRGANNQRERRLKEIREIIKKAKTEINQPVNETSFKLLGALTYWAEGAKYGQMAIINSDTLLIKFMVEWMRKVFNVQYGDMKIHLNIYPQQNETEMKKFWSDITNIPLSNFGKSFIKPMNKNYKKNTLYYGTAHVRLFKSSNNLYRTFGWVRKFLEDQNINVDEITTRWNSLKTDYGRVPITLPKKTKIQ
jgi:DNA-binding transcriptional MerR regulator